jgi:hypothetical protein
VLVSVWPTVDRLRASAAMCAIAAGGAAVVALCMKRRFRAHALI